MRRILGNCTSHRRQPFGNITEPSANASHYFRRRVCGFIQGFEIPVLEQASDNPPIFHGARNFPIQAFQGEARFPIRTQRQIEEGPTTVLFRIGQILENA